MRRHTRSILHAFSHLAGCSIPRWGRLRLTSSFGWWVELEGRLSLELGRVRSVPGEGVLGRYGHCGNNQRPGADAADGTSRTRALAVSRSHRRGRELPTPANKRIRCRHHGPVLFIGAASPTANPATDPPTSRPTYPRDREVPLACLVLGVSAIGGSGV